MSFHWFLVLALWTAAAWSWWRFTRRYRWYWFLLTVVTLSAGGFLAILARWQLRQLGL